MSTIYEKSDIQKYKPLIAVVGFTASGKTEVGIEIAQRIGGEIIAADAITVYKNFDIGSAKPTKKEMSKIPHHLIDLCNADEPMTVASFKKNATTAMQNIIDRGRVPLLVGGSGLYIDSILYDYEFRDKPNAALRDQLNVLNREELLKIINNKNFSLEGVDTHNKRRLIRLIESDGMAPKRRSLRQNTCVVALDVDREVLKERVTKRVDAMLQAGLEKEVLKLSQQYDWSTEAMRSIGYREWQPYFAKECDLAAVRDAIITHTMQLAKKQRTWFKRNQDICWVNNKSEAVDYATTFVNTLIHSTE